MRTVSLTLGLMLIILFPDAVWAQETQEAYDTLFSECMTCGPVVALYEYFRQTAQAFYVNISHPSSLLAGYLFAFVFMYRMFLAMTPISPNNLGEGMYTLTLKTLFVVAFLSLPEFTRDYIVDPIFSIGLDAAMSLVNLGTQSLATTSANTCSASSIAEVSGKMACIIHVMEENISWGIVAGWMEVKNIKLLSFETYYLFAIAIMIIYARLFITTPIILVEIIFVYGLVLIATPILLLAWIFPQTKGMVNIAIRHVIRIGFTMLFLAAIVNIVPFIMGYMVNDLVDSGVLPYSGVRGFLMAIESRDINFSPTEKTVWYLGLTGIVVGAMFSVARSFASSLSESFVEDMASKAKAEASGAVNTASLMKMATARTGNVLFAGGSKAAEAAPAVKSVAMALPGKVSSLASSGMQAASRAIGKVRGNNGD